MMKKEGPSISTINLGRIEKTKTNLIKEKGCLRLEDRRRSKKETKKKKKRPTNTENRKEKVPFFFGLFLFHGLVFHQIYT